MRRRVLLAGVLALLGLASATPAALGALPPIRHVFVIVLENTNYDTTFGPSSVAPYLSRQLPAQGQLLRQYYGIGHVSLDNYIALISGQGPNPMTQSDCQFYTDFSPGTPGADGQATGAGCVYPSSVSTVANQLQGRGLDWRGYMEDMGNSTTEPKECRHPALNSQDDTQSARPGDQYATRHNPFVYFHSIIDDGNSCAAHDVPLDRLAGDLGSVASTPSYSFITPNLCHDGHDTPCVDRQPGGLVSADRFLAQVVPMIMASPAYKADGLLAVTFDESGSGAEACCGERAANTANPGATSRGPGGGRVGAVLLSPFIRPGTVNDTPYNHYALLRSVEDLFALPHLGYAGQDGLRAFGDDVFSARAAAPTPPGPAGAPTPSPRGCVSSRVGRSSHGRLRRGALIGQARLVRARGRVVLALSTVHAARLHLTVGLSGGRSVRVRVMHLRACRTYRLTLPAHATRVLLSASVRGGHERRRLRLHSRRR